MACTICMITGAACCIPPTIPGITSDTITPSTCSATGTTCSVMKPTRLPIALPTVWAALMKPSKTAVPFAPKMLSIFWRAASMLPPENTFLIASPAAVTAATILLKISRPLPPKIRPTASRTLSKFFRRSCTTVITAVTTPTTGRIFPAMPPSGPSRVDPSFPSGPMAVFSAFPTGPIKVPSFPNAPLTTRPMVPSGLLAITPDRPDSTPPSCPPSALNGARIRGTARLPTPDSGPRSLPARLCAPAVNMLPTRVKRPPAALASGLFVRILPSAEVTPPRALPTFPK